MECSVTVHNGTLLQEEQNLYIKRATENYGKQPTHMDIIIDGEYVNIDYTFAKEPFERIRRITGYLVGTMDRFNNGKRAEERDRVKHSL
ncbi:MAG: anaerobic ribonucleoside-triphosphate reductase [Eubacteriales bacterium]|nr:anaerobic ribonucleoside-triphosphate reductase [Eubacteriales bacterium]